MVAFPRSDLFTLCNVASCSFWPMMRQEMSRSANGRTQGKDLGDPLWEGAFTTAPMPIAQAGEIEMALLSLHGVVHSFEAHDVRRPFPLAHQDGNFDDVSLIHDFGTDHKSLRLSGLPQGFTLSIGDYLAFDYGAEPNRALHRVTTPAVAGAGGITPLFEVFPHILPGAAVGASVTLKRASCIMQLKPGLQPPVAAGMINQTLTFSGTQLIL